MNLMIRLLCLLSFSGALVWAQGLSAVHTVYLLPMSKGLDQYLANRLTGEHVLQVVTDPKLADAVFTDRVGDSFELQWSAVVSQSTKQQAAAEKSDKEKTGKEEPAKDAAGKSAEEDTNARHPATSLLDTPVNALPDLSRNSSFGRARGTIFLVNPKSHQVVWSVYEVPKNSSSSQLDRTASDIVSRLKRDLKAKPAKE